MVQKARRLGNEDERKVSKEDDSYFINEKANGADSNGDQAKSRSPRGDLRHC